MTAYEDDLAVRRKRVRFRAWHRGMREVDLLLGRFADAQLADLGGEELAAFEALLDVPDQDVLAWLTDAGEPPDAACRAGAATRLRVPPWGRLHGARGCQPSRRRWSAPSPARDR